MTSSLTRVKVRLLPGKCRLECNFFTIWRLLRRGPSSTLARTRRDRRRCSLCTSHSTKDHPDARIQCIDPHTRSTTLESAWSVPVPRMGGQTDGEGNASAAEESESSSSVRSAAAAAVRPSMEDGSRGADGLLLGGLAMLDDLKAHACGSCRRSKSKCTCPWGGTGDTRFHRRINRTAHGPGRRRPARPIRLSVRATDPRPINQTYSIGDGGYPCSRWVLPGRA